MYKVSMRFLSKGIIVSLLTLTLACMSFTPVAFAEENDGADQDTVTNSSYETAIPLVDKKAVRGEVTGITGNSIYSFKTSNRASVYECWFEVVSDALMEMGLHDSYAQGRNFYELDDLISKRRGQNYILTRTRGVRFASGLKKNTDYYLQVKSLILGTQQFKIASIEHPILTRINKAKTLKKNRSAAKIAWTRQQNAHKYHLQYRVPGKKWKNVILKGNSAVLKNLKRNTAYQVRIRPYCPNAYDKATNTISQWGSFSKVWTLKTTK